MMHIRMPLRITTQREGVEFIKTLGQLDDSYSIESFDGKERVNARSMIGVLYAISDMGDNMYLVNNTTDGLFPLELEPFRR